MFTALAPVLVTSNQSAPSGMIPLDHGATSEMMIEPAADAGTECMGNKAAISDKRTTTLAIVSPSRIRQRGRTVGTTRVKVSTARASALTTACHLATCGFIHASLAAL